uniref:Uncharacterized protein n=2 Tax=Cucumis sativus TaxID=3659 RepID=A0A0A0K5V0_CUCSA
MLGLLEEKERVLVKYKYLFDEKEGPMKKYKRISFEKSKRKRKSTKGTEDNSNLVKSE